MIFLTFFFRFIIIIIIIINYCECSLRIFLPRTFEELFEFISKMFAFNICVCEQKNLFSERERERERERGERESVVCVCVCVYVCASQRYSVLCQRERV